MKRILVVNYNMIIGGSTTSLIGFLNYLDKKEYVIDLLLYRNEGELIDRIPKGVNLLPQADRFTKNKRIRKFIIAFFKGYYFKKDLALCQAKEFSRVLPAKYDIAIGYLEGWADKYVSFAAKADKKIGWLHSTFSNITKNPKAELSWMKQLDKIVCVSDSCRNELMKMLPEVKEKAVTIENIADVDFLRERAREIDEGDSAYRQISESTCFKIITICRLNIYNKGLDRVIKAGKVLKNHGLKFVWFILGDGADRQEFEKEVIKNDLQNELVIAGSRKNPYVFLLKADLLCLPSRWEGKPMVVKEAEALGVPCLVTNYLSASEQIKDGYNGIIVTNEDDSIVDALIRCIEKPGYVEQMKENLKDSMIEDEKNLEVIKREILS